MPWRGVRLATDRSLPGRDGAATRPHPIGGALRAGQAQSLQARSSDRNRFGAVRFYAFACAIRKMLWKFAHPGLLVRSLK